MKKMNLQLAGLAALVVLSAVVFWQMQTGDDSAEPTPLLAGFADALSEVSSVKVSASGDATTLVRRDGGWVIREKSDFPADFEKLLELLNGLAEAERSNPKTARAERHADLGLTTSDAGGTGVLVEIDTRTGDFYEVVIGKTSQHSGGTFVRLAGGNQTWLIDEALAADVAADEWIDAVIVNIESDSIQKVEMQTLEGEVLLVERDEESDNLEVRALPPGATLRYGTVADTLGRVLINVRAEDVQPLDAGTWADGFNRATFTRANGDLVYADTKQVDEVRLLRLSFELKGGSDLASLKQKENWQYEISSYAYDSLTKTMDDMVKPPEDEAASDDL